MNTTTIQADSDSSPLVLSDGAVNQLKKLVEAEGNTALMLRIYITGGGCSGFQYGFEFDETTNDDDLKIEKDGVSVIVDTMSLQYLNGAEVRFQEDLTGAQFVINNPNVSTTCGCGSSFSI